VQECLEMVLQVLFAHEIKNRILYKYSSHPPTFPSFLFMFWEFGVCLLCLHLYVGSLGGFFYERSLRFKVLIANSKLHSSIDYEPLAIVNGLRVSVILQC